MSISYHICMVLKSHNHTHHYALDCFGKLQCLQLLGIQTPVGKIDEEDLTYQKQMDQKMAQRGNAAHSF